MSACDASLRFHWQFVIATSSVVGIAITDNTLQFTHCWHSTALTIHRNLLTTGVHRFAFALVTHTVKHPANLIIKLGVQKLPWGSKTFSTHSKTTTNWRCSKLPSGNKTFSTHSKTNNKLPSGNKTFSTHCKTNSNKLSVYEIALR